MYWWSNPGLRTWSWKWPNEPARHKVLDLLGDLGLLGKKVQGHVIGFRSGHRLNLELCKKFMRSVMMIALAKPMLGIEEKILVNEINGPLSVLVTGAGSVYGLGIIRALKASVLPVEIIAIDTNPYSLGLFFADKSFIAPRAADEESYYMFIENLCKDHQIKAIFIGSTAELSFYARNRESLERSTGAKVFVNSPTVIELCTDKWLTMCHLSRSGFQIPASIRYPEDAGMLSSFIESAGFPLIVKPRMGRGSEGVVLVKDKQQLLENIKGKKSLIIQEYLTDEEQEFTVGICINQKGKVISKIALRRYLQEGVSIAAVSDGYHDIADYCADSCKYTGSVWGYKYSIAPQRWNAGNFRNKSQIQQFHRYAVTIWNK